MDCFGRKNKSKLSKKDLLFLKLYTNYDEEAIHEWIKALKAHPQPANQRRTWENYAVTGKMDNNPITVINIEGFGPLNFPILSSKIIEDLRPFMVKSDYGDSEGFGTKRIYDENVRLSSEIPLSRMKFIDPSLEICLVDTILPKIGSELGFNHLVTRADLQKLLIYEKGSFFSAHTDQVRANGHFGTLIIQLPSQYTGGQLICNYGLDEKVFDHSNHEFTHKDGTIEIKIEQSPTETCSEIVNSDLETDTLLSLGRNEFCSFYTAFYLDVEHEVKNVTSGIRACLVYSLIDATFPPDIVLRRGRVIKTHNFLKLRS